MQSDVKEKGTAVVGNQEYTGVRNKLMLLGDAFSHITTSASDSLFLVLHSDEQAALGCRSFVRSCLLSYL